MKTETKGTAEAFAAVIIGMVERHGDACFEGGVSAQLGDKDSAEALAERAQQQLDEIAHLLSGTDAEDVLATLRADVVNAWKRDRRLALRPEDEYALWTMAEIMTDVIQGET